MDLNLECDKAFYTNEMIDVMTRTIPAKIPIMLVGQPGHAKTDSVGQACDQVGADLIVAHPVVDGPEDYKGYPAVIEDEHGNKIATFLPFGNLKALIEAKKLTVYFFDDLGQAAKSVQSAGMQLMLARKINGHPVSGHVCFMAASNRKEDKSNVNGIIEAMKDRFAAICEVTVSLKDWCQWAYDPKNNIPPELVSFIRYQPQFLSDFKPTKDMKKSCTPRTIAMVGDLMKRGMPKPLELRLFASAAGKEFAIAFTGFLRVYRDLPDPDAVLMDPASADIPGEKSSLFALCGALSTRASEANIERFVAYTDRLDEEFAVLAMRDAVARDKELSKTEAFGKWVTKHHDILV